MAGLTSYGTTPAWEGDEWKHSDGQQACGDQGGSEYEEREETALQVLETTMISHPEGAFVVYLTTAAADDDSDPRKDVAVFRVAKAASASRGMTYIISQVLSRAQPDKLLYTWNFLSLFRLAVQRILRCGSADKSHAGRPLSVRLGTFSLLPLRPQ